MRKIFVCLAALFALSSGYVRAQTLGDPVQLYMVQLLSAPDSAVRARALREIEASASTLSPPVLMAVSDQLSRAGEFEEGLKWRYLAELRFVADAVLGAIGTNELVSGQDMAQLFVQSLEQNEPAEMRRISPERRRQILAQAQRMDQRLARAYRFDWGNRSSQDRSSQEAPPWPERQAINAARSQAARLVRTQLEESARRHALEAELVEQIESGRMPAEATNFIPEDFRTRIRVRHAVYLSDDCAGWSTLKFSPSGSRSPLLVVTCASSGAESSEAVSTWIDTAEGRVVGTTMAPQNRVQHSSMAVRGGRPMLIYAGAGSRDVVLMDSGGRIEQLVPPTLASVRFYMSASTRSGRYLIYGGSDIQAVLDVETNQWLWERPRPPTDASSIERDRTVVTPQYQYADENAAGDLILVGINTCRLRASCPGTALVVRNHIQGTERTLPLANATSVRRLSSSMAYVSYSYRSPRGAAVQNEGAVRTFDSADAWRVAEAEQRTNEPPQIEAAIVDINSMQIVWAGPREQAPKYGDPRCVALPDGISSMVRRMHESINIVSLGGEELPIGRSDRAGPSACAISPDGASLALMAGPIIYVYEIAQQ